MAQLNLASSEIPKVITLIEQFFPGVDLKPMATALAGITASGTLELNKTINSTESLQLSLTLTAN